MTTLLLALIPLFIAVAVGLVAHYFLGVADEHADVRSTLRAMEEGRPADLRQQELMVPLTQRLLAPIGRSLVGVSRSFMPSGYMEGIRRKLIVAGRPAIDELDRFRALRVLTVVGAPAVFVIAYLA